MADVFRCVSEALDVQIGTLMPNNIVNARSYFVFYRFAMSAKFLWRDVTVKQIVS